MSLKVIRIMFTLAVSVSMTFVASRAFAQAAVLSGSIMDTAGAPGTEAPADPAPIGKISSDWMSHANLAMLSHRSAFSLPSYKQIRAEEMARTEENRLVRQLVLARTRGQNVDAAARNQWLGTISLARGDRAMAENYFHRAEAELATDRVTAHHVDAIGLGDDPDAVNLHPNSGTATAY